MHSYIAYADGTYVVGIWLMENNKPKFRKMFSVEGIRQAVQAVCMLQGGTGGSQVSPPDILLEYRDAVATHKEG